MRSILLTLNATILYVFLAYLLNLFAVREAGSELLLLAIVANVAVAFLLLEFELKKYALLQAAIAMAGALLTFPFLACLAIPGVIEAIRK